MGNPGEEVALTKSGKPRARRPNGELYSEDPSVRMVQLKEDGRAGGQFGKLGGRPRKPRAAEELAEHARRRVDEIKRTFDDALEDEQPMKIRLQAANDLIAIERQESQLQLDEDKLDSAPREELQAEIIELLNDPQIAGALGIEYDDDDEEIVDAEVVT
jgi:hypothetical protein